MGLDAEAIVVSTHSRLKAAGEGEELPESDFEVSTHSRLKAAGVVAPIKVSKPLVSTHSRLKAAGYDENHIAGICKCFNTQPPKGGWSFKGYRHER